MEESFVGNVNPRMELWVTEKKRGQSFRPGDLLHQTFRKVFQIGIGKHFHEKIFPKLVRRFGREYGIADPEAGAYGICIARCRQNALVMEEFIGD